MKLKRPNISPGKWEQNVDTVRRGDRWPKAAVFHPINNAHSIADAQAAAAMPEVMDLLERFCREGVDLLYPELRETMKKMGYTEVKEGEE